MSWSSVARVNRPDGRECTETGSSGAGFFRFGRSNELSQMLNVRAGVFVQELSQRVVFADQTVAPLFQQMLPGRVFRRGLIKFSQSGLNRLWVNFPHQLAQILHLAAPASRLKRLASFTPTSSCSAWGSAPTDWASNLPNAAQSPEGRASRA